MHIYQKTCRKTRSDAAPVSARSSTAAWIVKCHEQQTRHRATRTGEENNKTKLHVCAFTAVLMHLMRWRLRLTNTKEIFNSLVHWSSISVIFSFLIFSYPLQMQLWISSHFWWRQIRIQRRGIINVFIYFLQFPTISFPSCSPWKQEWHSAIQEVVSMQDVYAARHRLWLNCTTRTLNVCCLPSRIWRMIWLFTPSGVFVLVAHRVVALYTKKIPHLHFKLEMKRPAAQALFSWQQSWMPSMPLHHPLPSPRPWTHIRAYFSE